MARKVYFSFHYQNDIWRVNQVRNHKITKEDIEEAGFYDGSLWEEAKKKGDLEIKRMINAGLKGASVNVVLIGSQTYSRRWVRYEIVKSFVEGKGQFGIYIHKNKDQNGLMDICKFR